MINTQATTSSRISEADLALCRSALYEALALAFLPPGEETVERLLSLDQNRALADVGEILDMERPGGSPGPSIATLVRRLSDQFGERPLERIEASYRRLFGHVAHSAVPLYETEYGEETLFQQPQQLADITGFLRAFRLTVALARHERVDHISCECEFLGFLACKEAYALEGDEMSIVTETRKAQRLFLRDHLGRFVPSFANLLRRADADGLYGALGDLCSAFVIGECARYDVTPGPALLRLRPTEVFEDNLECGAGPDALRAVSCGCSNPKGPR